MMSNPSPLESSVKTRPRARVEDTGALLQAAGSQGFEPVLLRNPHPRVRHQDDPEPVALCNTVDLLLHRAAVRIHYDLRQP